MPLHYGKIFALIALVTVFAFILWQLWVAVFVGESVDTKTGLDMMPPSASRLVLSS